MDSEFMQRLKAVQGEVDELEKEAKKEADSGPSANAEEDAAAIFAEHNAPGTDAQHGCKCAICKAYREAHA